MDLVGDHPGAVPEHHVAHPLELGAGEHPSPRVVRLGEQQGAGAVGEQRVQPVQVDLGALGVRVDDQVDAFAAGDLGDRQLRCVRRHRHHHRSRIGHHVEREPHPGGHVDHGNHVPGVDLVPEVPLREPGVRRPELAADVERRVATQPRLDRASQRVDDRRRQGVVHLGHPGGEHLRRGGAPLERQRTPGFVVREVADHSATLQLPTNDCSGGADRPHVRRVDHVGHVPGRADENPLADDGFSIDHIGDHAGHVVATAGVERCLHESGRGDRPRLGRQQPEDVGVGRPGR